VPQEEEIAEIAFFPADDLPEGVRPYMRHRIDALVGNGFGGVVYLEEKEI
jgi:hypothetical protein